ncbi:entericidin [Tianweitania sediminis]|jgi:entericidin B|uniref:Entericidin n=1 Tax=Tianweitania sediminis TaxID=1502156 RepID=A0A8J7R163_9HYPH|nr:entericidin [Tianweitania sediminis]MBP0440768.1 entericidin [Tianweitania sediminis]
MTYSRIATVAVLGAALLSAACANTIRGVGADTANTVNATQSAGANVAKAAQ